MLPKISVWSQFRDAAGEQISRYIKQVNALDYPPELLRFYVGEGDSTDNTLAELHTWAVVDSRVTVVKHDTGRPYLKATPHPARLATLAEAGNAVWDVLAADRFGDFALMLESDIIYKPGLLRRLYERMPVEANIVAPMVWVDDGYGLRFYDVWAFRVGGQMFTPASPTYYFSKFPEPFAVDSVGSVALIEMGVIGTGCRLTNDAAIVGLCNEAREIGYNVYCDPDTHVLHPPLNESKRK